MSGRLGTALGLLAALPVGLPPAAGYLSPGVHQAAHLAGAERPGRSAVLTADPRVVAVGAENEYANVISQIGGRYVKVSAVMSNPTTDPHAFEASPRVARLVAGAGLVVQNGLGYDSFMRTIENASPNPERKVIVVQSLLGAPSSTPNPHLWYRPTTMPVVARAVARALSRLQPAHRSVFRRNLARFDSSLHAWTRAISRLRAKFAGSPVAVTEPVADYLLAATGLDNRTPFSFQADSMNGVDPSPQDIAYVQQLLSKKRVKAFVYNEQVTDSLTQSLLASARRAHVPVVGVYETMPEPGYDYQRWMVAEVDALEHALENGVSSQKL